MLSLRWLTRVAVVAAIAAAPVSARAQGAGEQAAAEALFKQGRDLMNAGRFADACPKLAGVRNADPKLNGCPADGDKDGIYDVEDACPDVAGIKTDDPKTNG